MFSSRGSRKDLLFGRVGARFMPTHVLHEQARVPLPALRDRQRDGRPDRSRPADRDAFGGADMSAGEQRIPPRVFGAEEFLTGLQQRSHGIDRDGHPVEYAPAHQGPNHSLCQTRVTSNVVAQMAPLMPLNAEVFCMLICPA